LDIHCTVTKPVLLNDVMFQKEEPGVEFGQQRIELIARIYTITWRNFR
jgi:hypothetical protein